jgi:hypothetical protein
LTVAPEIARESTVIPQMPADSGSDFRGRPGAATAGWPAAARVDGLPNPL